MLKMTENNTKSKTNMGIVAPHVNSAGPDDCSDDDEDVKKLKAQLYSFSDNNENIQVKCSPDSENYTKKKFCKEKNRSDSENNTKKKFCKEKNRSGSEKNTKKRFWQKGKPMLNEGTVLCP